MDMEGDVSMQILHHATVVSNGQQQENGFVAVENGTIAAVGTGPVPARYENCRQIDLAGAYLCPGFIDPHCHGGGGFDFMDGTVEAIVGAAKAHLQYGTTTIAPTSLSSSDEALFAFLKNFQAAKQVTEGMPHFLGVHLEGPHFSPAQAGAQPSSYLKPPSVAFAREVLQRSEGSLIRWSIAPELDGALETGDYLCAHGVLPSIGHTDAVYDDIVAAVQHGYTHMTHFYSGMSQMRRVNAFRVLGAVECGYLMDELHIELIADGMHLPPELLRLILKCKPHDKITLVTDSMRGAGMPEGPSILGSLQDGVPAILEDGIAKLPDRSAFAGSIATTDRLVRTMWKLAGVPLPDAIRMMTENPAKLLRIDGRKGRLLPGKDADVVLFDEDVAVQSVYYMGKRVR